MIESIEKRFNKSTSPRLIRFLSDRGSIYKSKETKSIAIQINLQSCFTMTFGFESYGMAEAFVKTIKRDYVHTNDCVDPDAASKVISDWFKDYNDNTRVLRLKG